MTEFSVEELKNIHAICEGRIHADNFVKALVPQMDVLPDILSTSSIAEKVKVMVREKIEAEQKKAKEVEKG